MVLRRLELTGFKSFANKTSIELESGITGIVGPNGSGKSNIADAIRWVLGEQSSKSLRLKKNEEVVFAGSDQRARASLAEVSLLLDNADGAMAIDFSQVQLTRRLYRSGESEYQLNGRKVRWAEIQQLLAGAGFGVGSYAVIGQGLIDELILASPAERKLLFDEASGIRSYELKREQALKKLAETEANLIRLGDIVAELEPQHKLLSQRAATAGELKQLEAKLSATRRQYLTAAAAMSHHRLQSAHQSQAVLQQRLNQERKNLEALEAEHTQLREVQAQALQQRGAGLKQLQRLELTRDKLANDASVKRAELTFLLEKVAAGERLSAELAALEQQIVSARLQEDLALVELQTCQAQEEAQAVELKKVSAAIARAQANVTKLRQAGDDSSRVAYLDQAAALVKQAAHGLATSSVTAEHLRLVLYKVSQLLKHARHDQAGSLTAIRQAQDSLGTLMKLRHDLAEQHGTILIRLRTAEFDHAQHQAQLAELAARSAQLKQTLKKEAPTKILAQRKHKLELIEQRLVEVTKEVSTQRTAMHEPAVEEAAAAVYDLAAALTDARARLEATSREAEERVPQAAEHGDELARLAQRAEQWEISDMDLSAELNAAGAGEPDPAIIERELWQLESALSVRQSSDEAFSAEYQALSERLSWLGEQIHDLTTAKADLTKIIDQLDEVIQRQFESACGEIAQAFAKYFVRLFGGGRADLSFDRDDSGRYGIEISAAPPGKRIAHLNSLSGGERSLVAVALLTAILSVNSSPFVVLDEVDAALDESNSLRLVEILREIAPRSQLLVISHNRQVMAASHCLFGVTMDPEQVSSLVSLRLATARELLHDSAAAKR